MAIFVRMGLDSEEIKYRQINPNLEVAVVRRFGTSKNTDIIYIQMEPLLLLRAISVDFGTCRKTSHNSRGF